MENNSVRVGRKRKYNLRKTLKRLSALALILVIVGYGMVSYLQPTIAGTTSKPSVLIWRYGGSGVGNTSAATMETVLSAIADVTLVDSMPSLATANSYDAFIVSTDTYAFGTQMSTAEKDFLDQYLNNPASRGHLIIEGEQIVNKHTAVTQVRTNILKTSGYSSSNSASSIRIVNTTHPVTTGLSTSSITVNESANFRAVRPMGTRLAEWTNSGSTDTVLSIWEGSSRHRQVFMNFGWDNWDTATQTTRNGVLINAVKWVSDFAEVQLTGIAPAEVSPGAVDVTMAKLKLSSYANAKNNNINTITSFSVYHTGTANVSSYGTLRVYNADASGNPTSSIPLASTVFANGKATFKNMKLQVGTGDKYVVITTDVVAEPDEGHTMRLKLCAANEFTTKEKGSIKIYGTDESNSTNIQNITPPSVPTQAYTTNLATGTSLRVDWKADTEWDWVGYKVYRAVDSGSGVGAYVYQTAVNVPYFNDTGLTQFHRYYYKITAYDIAGNNSDYSEEVVGIPNAPPSTPTGLNATNPANGHSVNLSWNAVTGEPNDIFNGNNPDIQGYNLYAATNSSGPYGKVNETPITTTSYTHAGLKDGTTYYYKIVSVDKYGLESSLSAYVSATPSDTTAPQIVSFYPTEGQDYVERNVTIRVKFDEILDTSGGINTWIKVEQKNADDSYTDLTGTVAYSAYTFELTFDPTSDLGAVGTFRVTVKGGAGGVKSYATNPNLATDRIWTFGTLLNPHTDFQNNKTLCGYCHSAHSATGQQVIRQPKILDLCFMCHDGTGSSYDVKGGKYYNGEQAVPLAAGGYDTSLGSTSTHFTDLANAVYGSPGYVMPIDCNTCHQPHGSTNFRNIRTTINGEAVDVSAVVYGPAYGQKTVSGYEITTYVSGWEQFCGVCHSEYQIYHSVTSISGEENWRHRTGMPLAGGSTDGRWVVEYPTPGLYTTLPTLGPSTGANVTNYEIMSGGSLGSTVPGATYNYIVTGVNAVGESVYGKIMQVPNVLTGSKIRVDWERIANAYKYRIYRKTGTGDPNNMDVTTFAYLAEVADEPTYFIDNVTAPDGARKPPMTSSAKVTCITCHIVHGTPAVADNGEETRLRRYDNDGLCQDCHKK